MAFTVSIVGKKKCGKTTLIEKLIKELKLRGYRVATIKHDSHGFDIDHPGTDTWRHARAGSDCVTISSPRGIAMMKTVDKEWPLDRLIALNQDADIILTEGYRMSGAAKIEVVRADRSTEPICRPEELLAVATDIEVDLPGVPACDINDYLTLTGIIEAAAAENKTETPVSETKK